MRMARTASAALIAGLVLSGAAFGQAGDPFRKPQPQPGAGDRDTPPLRSKPQTAPEGQGQLVDLRPKFKKGQELRYVMEVDGKNKIVSKSNEDLNQDQTMSQRIGLVMRVKEAGDDGATLEVVYESIRVVMDTPDGKAEFDSAKAKKKPDASKPKPGQPAGAPAGGGNALDDLLAQIIGPMVGTRLEVKTDKNGAITSVTGGEALSGGAIEGLLGGTAGGPGGMVPSGKSAANWLTGGIPGSDGRVRIGQTWTNTDDLGSTPAGAFKMVTTHTLKSHAGGLAMVMFNGRAEGAQSESGGPLGGMIKLKGAGYRGQYQWDTGAGALREMNSEMTTEMTGKIGEDEVTMTGSTTTRVKKQ